MNEPALHVLPSWRYAEALAREWGPFMTWWDRFVWAALQRPRAFYGPKANAVFVQLLAVRDERLLAHEYGHYLGLDHPPRSSLAYWLDVCGNGLRLTDRHALMARSRAWRESRAS